MQDEFKIYDERPISLTRRPVVFIYHDGTRDKAETLTMGPPLLIDRTVVCGYKASTGPHLRPTTRSITPKGLMRSVRAIAANAALCMSNRVTSTKPIFDFRDIEPNNVAHLMCAIIPACLYLRESVGPDILFLLRPIKAPFRQFLNAFGIEPCVTAKSIQGTVLKLLAVRGFATENAMHLPDCPPISLFPDAFAGFEFSSSVESTKKVFIARRGPRALLNHKEVESLLESLGYKTIFMEDYSTETQLGIAREATDIVAVHGASLSSAVVSPHINSLIEIVPSHAYHEYFPASFGKRVDRYIQIMPKMDRSIAFSNWETIVRYKNAPFELPLGQLSLAISLAGDQTNRIQTHPTLSSQFRSCPN